MASYSKRRTRLYILLALGFYVMLMLLLSYLESHAKGASIKGLGDAIWYSVVTLTTVGYGDYYPITTGGKIIGFILLLGSVGVIGYIIGNISNTANQYMEDKKLGLNGTKFKNHTIIIGWNDFGRLVANQLLNANSKVAIVTNNKNNVDSINGIYPDNKNVFVLFADYHNMESLNKVNIDKAASIFINFNDDTETLVYMLNIKNVHPEKSLIVTINNSNLKNTFHNAGVDYIVSKNDLSSKLVASFIYEPEVAAFTEDIMEAAVHPTLDFDMQQFLVLESNPYKDKDCVFVFMNMKKKYDAIFMGAVKQQKGKWILYKNPSEETIIRKGDYIILVSNIEARLKVEADFGVEEGKIFSAQD